MTDSQKLVEECHEILISCLRRIRNKEVAKALVAIAYKIDQLADLNHVEPLTPQDKINEIWRD